MSEAACFVCDWKPEPGHGNKGRSSHMMGHVRRGEAQVIGHEDNPTTGGRMVFARMPPLAFPIFPEDSSRAHALHVFVRISPTLETMYADARALGVRDESLEDCAGLHHCKDRGTHKRNDFGVIFFAKSCLSAEIVVHEIVHAALSWAIRVGIARKGLDMSTKDEERFAMAIERMVTGFYVRLSEHLEPERI